MGWHDRLNLTIGAVLAMVPFVVMVWLMVHREDLMRLKLWRYRLAIWGLALGMIATLPTPLFYFGLELPDKMKSDAFLLAASRSMLVALGAGLAGIVFLAFAQARVRWLGIAMTLVSLAMLYVTLLGMSD